VLIRMRHAAQEVREGGEETRVPGFHVVERVERLAERRELLRTISRINPKPPADGSDRHGFY
jgi:hypothetical protein